MTPCWYWNGSPGSCRWGGNCRFLHALEQSTSHSFLGEADEASGSTGNHWTCTSSFPSSSSAAVPVAAQVPRACRAWSGVPGSCRFGARCRFVHDDVSSTPAIECCVCLEVPWQREGKRLPRDYYALLENCDHVVCMSCIMEWRKKHEASREARLGCPVCRTISHIIVPWHCAASGDEKLAIVAQHKERCSVTTCKWSSNGQPCPAGKHCLYDHSEAPQVVRRRAPRHEVSDTSSDSDTSTTRAYRMLALLELGFFSSDSDAESDDEIRAAVNALQALNRFRRELRPHLARRGGRARGRGV
eukprot:TRINITY_DN7391_c0_g1_i2.p1 TRINITY_DN7391_c0_g1~~TRINITY_DN7391_c0_g1_i2.p1  ORF type:complete len:301 (+),score=32.29 TRINITY_DN7391_c0_g1_i2:77-979(+)